MYFLRKKTCKEGHLMDPSWKKCPICIAPVGGWLVLIDGKNKSKSHIFTIHVGKNKIGEGADCELRILLDSISRHHAMLTCYPGNHSITDLSSSGGTFVNNRQVSNQNIIDGDIIRLGDVEFKFKGL